MNAIKVNALGGRIEVKRLLDIAFSAILPAILE